jgi:hypothetical protein
MTTQNNTPKACPKCDRPYIVECTYCGYTDLETGHEFRTTERGLGMMEFIVILAVLAVVGIAIIQLIVPLLQAGADVTVTLGGL